MTHDPSKSLGERLYEAFRSAFGNTRWENIPPDLKADYEKIAVTFVSTLSDAPQVEEFLEFKEALSDLRSLRAEHLDLNGGGPGWMARWLNAWVTVDELFANEDEAAWVRQQEDAHG